MTSKEFQEWLQKDMKWDWEINFDSSGSAEIKVIFEEAFPTLDNANWRARAYLIAPNFRKTANMRGIKSGRHKGGYFSAETPRWYPLPDGGWRILESSGYYPSFETVAGPFIGFMNQDSNTLVLDWLPYGNSEFSEVIKGYTYEYCKKVMKGTEYYANNYNGDGKLTGMGEIRQKALDVYLSVAISFVIGEGGEDTCVYRSFGVPKHFISGELF